MTNPPEDGDAAQSTGPLIQDSRERADLEARNSLQQFHAIRELVADRAGSFRISPRDICELQAIAVRGVFRCAGSYRSSDIEISNSTHRPPTPSDLPHLVQEMCDYVNRLPGHDQETQAIHIASYLIWRLNWIHPFADGNGRTARAIAYFAICAVLGYELPGSITVPELIMRHRKAYYVALDASDEAWQRGFLDLEAMESLISDLLAEQLSS